MLEHEAYRSLIVRLYAHLEYLGVCGVLFDRSPYWTKQDEDSIARLARESGLVQVKQPPKVI